MISAESARQFAAIHFPQAPEKLARELGVAIKKSKMVGCDGYCLSNGDKAIIRINESLGISRYRFTLAHELGHLILGVPSIVGETYEEMLSSSIEEERRVNRLASELLMPRDIVVNYLPDVPVVSDGLKRLAKKAKVSEVAAAIRVCNLAEEIGLRNALVVLFNEDGSVRWQWSRSLKITEVYAFELRRKVHAISPNVFREENSQGEVVVASTIENKFFGSATMFVQLLPQEAGLVVSPHERRRELEVHLFSTDIKLQQRVNGFFGVHNNRIRSEKMSFDKAETDFWRRYAERLSGTVIDSDIGREYVTLRIKELG